MNRAYRMIWSAVRDAWIIVAENVKAKGRPAPRFVGTVLAAAVLAAGGVAAALPTGPQVVSGSAAITTSGGIMNVTNSANAIINWQGFSIGSNEVTRFIQPSAVSAVLNRVTGGNPSQILGALQSNGKVLLINPSGIIFGPNARVDVNGLIASSLNITNQDFLAGRMKFTAGPTAGKVENQGAITTPSGGQVYLIAPDVQNSGVITAPNGDVLLAAGKEVLLVDSSNPEIAMVVTAPEGQAINLGTVVADAGRVGMYGSVVRQKGRISANSAVRDASGRIFLRAAREATLSAGSSTSANGPQGGSITVQASEGTTLVSGAIEAKGSNGTGGTVQLLGQQVGLVDSATVSVSGATAGGSVLVGGDYQGKNLAIQNAQASYMGKDAVITADAVDNGNGGTVILWSDNTTRAYGSIYARGGANGGDGGFVEVSGKASLDFRGIVDTHAPLGRAGTLLLDPTDITITTLGGAPSFGNFSSSGSDQIFDGGANSSSSMGWNYLNALLSTNNVVVQTISTGAGTGNITFSEAGVSAGGANSLSFQAENTITVSSSIQFTSSGTLSLSAGNSIAINDNISATGGGAVQLTTTGLNKTISLAATKSITNTNGAVILQSDNMDLQGSISSNQLTLLPATIASTAINLGGADSAGILGLTDAELNTITSPYLTIGSGASAGGITTSAAISLDSAKVQYLELISSGACTFSNPLALTGTGAVLTLSGSGSIAQAGAGVLTADHLEITSSSASVNLSTADNMINSLGGALTSASTAAFSFKNGQQLAVSGLSFSPTTTTTIQTTGAGGSLNLGLISTTAAGGTLNLNVAASIIDTNSTAVNVSGVGTLNLTTGNGMSLDVADATSITAINGTVGVPATNGVAIRSSSSSNANLNLAVDQTVSGADPMVEHIIVSHNGPITASGSGIISHDSTGTTAGGNIEIISSGPNASNKSKVFASAGSPIKTLGSGVIHIEADEIAFNSSGAVSTDTSSGLVSVTPYTKAAPTWNIGACGTLPCFDIPSLQNITTNTLYLGDDTGSVTGDLSINASVTFPSTLVGLGTGGYISKANAAVITANILGVKAGGYIYLGETTQDPNSVNQFAAHSTGGLISFKNDKSLVVPATITDPFGLMPAGVVSDTAAVALSLPGNGDITLVGPISAGTSVSLSAAAGKLEGLGLISGTSLSITNLTGVGTAMSPLTTDVGSLSVSGGSSGGVFIDNGKPLTSVSVSTAAGDVMLTNNGSMTVSSVSTSSSNNVSLLAGGASSDITLTPLGTINAGTVQLDAGRNILVNGGHVYAYNTASLHAGGAINVSAAGGNYGSVAADDLSLDAVQDITVNGGSLDAFGMTGLASLHAGGNITIAAVAGFNAEVVAAGEVSLTATSGKLYLNSYGANYARIISNSPNTVYLDVPSQSAGGYVIDSIEGGATVSTLNSSTGIFVGDASTPAVVGSTLLVTNAAPPPPPPPPPPPTIDQCTADPTLAGCTAVLPTIDTCTTTPTAPGCSVVLPSIATCTTTPTAPGCTAVLPTIDTCTTTPTAPGCSVVLPSIATCTTTPTAPGCTAVLPTIDTCTTTPTAPGCSVVLPTVTDCAANPAAPGCVVVLPPTSNPTLVSQTNTSVNAIQQVTVSPVAPSAGLGLPPVPSSPPSAAPPSEGVGPSPQNAGASAAEGGNGPGPNGEDNDKGKDKDKGKGEQQPGGDKKDDKPKKNYCN